MIIDTHVHLNDPQFENNLDEIISDAIANNVQKMIVIGYDKVSSLRAIEIAEQYPNIYASIGVHPSEVNKFDDDNLEWIIQNLKHPKVIAIGEVGLDYYWDTSFKEKQIEYFNKQIEIAKKFQFPLIIHSRKAINETFELLKDSKVNGIMHCYSGSIEMARRFIGIGFYLGIGGVLTFKNTNLKELVKEISLDYLVTETDAPYLAPEPYRGKQNVPKYTKIVVQEIARLKDLEIETVEQKIEENVKKIFKI